MVQVPVPLMFTEIRKHLVGAGQCFRRDWTALLISIEDGMITKKALVICMASFGLDWTR